ncbi:hypothetical protein GCM10023189_61060 [Nibrella saemangeumensis]|uniref:Cytochrome c domain-containing protein n=1 Tax=Nibrella saemangeumensis TaxID=1084526 RepID=A0ABP8NTP5_9BACT
MRKQILAIALLALSVTWYGCSSDGAKQRSEETPTDPVEATNQQEVHGDMITEVKLTTPLDQAMVKQGQEIYDVKCGSCHKLDETRIVGPGWKGITQRREPAWIMNMITNVDMMLANDAEAQKLLEQCLVRMPNQNITEPEARSVLEFMRQNDGVK